MRASLRTTLGVLAGLALAGCASTSDPLQQPLGLDGTWVIVTANEQAPPALMHDITYFDTGEHVQMFVTHDTITISGTTYRQRAVTYAESNGVRIGTQLVGDHGLVAQVGPDVHFESDFYQNRTFDGTLAGGDLTVVQDLAAQGTTARYLLRRVSR